ncbi:MAG TPA: MCE family protein [Actinomycetota bacterium]|nr:MCE family protein [Actinomycetota bacterium]
MIEAPPRPAPAPAEPQPPTPRPPRQWHFPTWLKGLGITLLALILFLAAVRWAYGGFENYTMLSVDLPRAGQQLDIGATDVRMNGVNIGTMVQKELVPPSPNATASDRGWYVRLTLRIEDRYRVPANTEAVVTLKTLLGAKVIEFRFPRYAPPWLEDGDTVRSARIGPELEDALDDGVRVLEAIPADDLATVIHELSVAARGHGRDVARGLKANSELADLFADTLEPQIAALNDFEVIFNALRDKGVDLNLLADAMNEGVPVYASAEAQAHLRSALEAVVPFSNNLADLLILNRRDWDRMMDAGNVVLTTLAVRPQGLRSVVHGLGDYVESLGGDPCNRFFANVPSVDSPVDPRAVVVGVSGTNLQQRRECNHLNDGSASAPFAAFEGEGGSEGSDEGGGADPLNPVIAEFCAATMGAPPPFDEIRAALGCPV